MSCEMNAETHKIARALMDYHAPIALKNVLGDWTVTVHHDNVYLWDNAGQQIATVGETDGVICMMCDPVHVNDALKEIRERLSKDD